MWPFFATPIAVTTPPMKDKNMKMATYVLANTAPAKDDNASKIAGARLLADSATAPKVIAASENATPLQPGKPISDTFR